MNSPRRLAVVAGFAFGIFLIIAGLLYFTRPNEPGYEGKTLSEWIAPFCSQTSTGLYVPLGSPHFEELQPVRHAVSAIGTNALPCLTGKLRRRESAMHLKLRELAKKQPLPFLRLADPHCAKIRAIRALAVLGPSARPAIPALSAQLSDPILSDHAAYALSAMGSVGVRVLIEQFTNTATAGRMVTAMALVAPRSIYRGENSTHPETNDITLEIQVSGLRQLLEGGQPMFRFQALQRLSDLGPAASNAVPALLPILNQRSPMDRQLAIRALARIKTPAEIIVPALTNLVNDSDLAVQMLARWALRDLGYDLPYRSGLPGTVRQPGFTPLVPNGPATDRPQQ